MHNEQPILKQQLRSASTVFIDQYRLESNPFALHSARPYFASTAVRYTSLKVAQLLEGQIQCLFLSGAAGVGKTELVERQLQGSTEVSAIWINPGIESAAELLSSLLRTLGPGTIEGSTSELRHILHVFLQHQASQGRQSLVIADSLERQPLEVLRELETLCRVRLRKRPVIQFIMLTRNEDLVAHMLSDHDGGYLARAVHHRLTGFTVEETSSYIRTALQGAGCVWSEELFADTVMADIQAFTRGVVRDVDALCANALDALAEHSGNSVGQPRVTRGLLKDIAARLHMRYDAAALKMESADSLLPNAVQLTDPNDIKIEAAKLLVSSGGQAVAEITLNRPRMVLGRDHTCDISLNSSFVSRYQNLFMETEEGWMLIDLNSTTGCFVNGIKVSEHRLREGDLISVGRHQLRFAGPSMLSTGTSETGNRKISSIDTLMGSFS